MPKGVNSFEATWGVAVPQEILNDIPKKDYDEWVTEKLEYMNTANGEDRVLVERLFQGSQSKRLPKGTYHPIEKNLWQFTRYLAKITA